MNFTAKLNACIALAEQGIDTLLPAATTRPARLHEAMRYSMQAGGKRLRPVLLLAAADLRGNPLHDPLPAAVAIECVHTYSLIHDDLPCMDNDDLRRGRPAAHRQYDEATALLAGDALLTHAFLILSTRYSADPELARSLVRELATAAGSERLVAGQMEDVLAVAGVSTPASPEAHSSQLTVHSSQAAGESAPARGRQTENCKLKTENSGIAIADVDYIHLNKTAAMISAALVMGGLCGGLLSGGEIDSLRALGRELGLAFQIVDDILDATADTATLGKTPGKDAKSGKTTCVSLHGIEGARRHAAARTQAALAALAQLPGDTTFLRRLVALMLDRKN